MKGSFDLVEVGIAAAALVVVLLVRGVFIVRALSRMESDVTRLLKRTDTLFKELHQSAEDIKLLHKELAELRGFIRGREKGEL